MIYIGALYIIGYFFLINSLFYIWRIRDVTGITLGFFFICIGYLSIYTGLAKSSQIFLFPYLLGTDTIVYAFGVVIIFLNLMSALNRDFKWENKYWLFFLYPLAQVLLYVPYLYEGSDAQLAMTKKIISENKITYYSHPFGLILQILMTWAISIYTLYGIKTKYKFTKAAPKFKIIGVISGIFISFLSFFLIYVFHKILFLSANLTTVSPGEYVVFYSTIFILYQFIQIWPYYAKHGRVYYTNKLFHYDSYFSQHLQKSEIEKIDKSLNALMKEKEIYKDEKLKINNLANELKISPHKLSVFLNEYYKQSFSEYINLKRVEDAKKILIEEPEINIIDICYEVGFNSPSAFYKAFKKEAKMSPKEWLNKKPDRSE
ncbi:MAG: helix-turn-helix domain-containing protein [Spirochaetia bacterium]|nr:helix-turn-helix domain-containing protein [Spirochaetia bacterium]